MSFLARYFAAGGKAADRKAAGEMIFIAASGSGRALILMEEG
jgi:hypothetical protein